MIQLVVPLYPLLVNEQSTKKIWSTIDFELDFLNPQMLLSEFLNPHKEVFYRNFDMVIVGSSRWFLHSSPMFGGFENDVSMRSIFIFIFVWFRADLKLFVSVLIFVFVGLFA